MVDEEIPPLLCKVLWVPRKALYKCNKLLLLTKQVFYAQSYFPHVPRYSFYNEVLLFICTTLLLQLPMEVLQDQNIEEDRLDDHQEDCHCYQFKSLKAEEHVSDIGIDYLK